MPELTPQDVHEVYSQAVIEDSNARIIPADWKDVSQHSLALYKRMAELLNEKIAQKEEKGEVTDE
jgi:hypothetical protein